jgi:hypothetical protein
MGCCCVQASRPSSSDKQSVQTAPVTPKSASVSRHASPVVGLAPRDQWTDPTWPSHRELWPHAVLSCQPVSRNWPWDDATDSGTSTDIDLSVGTPHGRGRLAWSLYTITMHLKQRALVSSNFIVTRCVVFHLLAPATTGTKEACR